MIFRLVDLFYIVMMILPPLAGIVLKILTTPPSEGINVSGAGIYFTIPMPIQDFPVTEAQVVSVIVIISIFFLCLYLTHGLKENVELKRQHLAEIIVEKVDGLVSENMGEYFKGYSPFIIAILALSAFSSLSSLLGLYPPTSDINIVAGWSILVFFLITYYKLKCGPLYYVKGFLEPTPILAPINLIGEFSTPISMAFRHYGNILSGNVISVLLTFSLSALSAKILSFLPSFLSSFPILRVGIQAVLSVYFDVFSGCLQAFIFAILTMLNISGAFPMEDYFARQSIKNQKKKKHVNQ